MLAFWQALIASASDHGLEHKALPKQFELMNHWRNGGVGIDDPLQEFESCGSLGCSSFNNVIQQSSSDCESSQSLADFRSGILPHVESASGAFSGAPTFV